MSEIAEKWESLAETVNWGTQMLIRSCKGRPVESEHIAVEHDTHSLELEVDIRQVRERIVHVCASLQPQPVEPVVTNRCLRLRDQSIEITALASKVDENLDRDTSVLC